MQPVFVVGQYSTIPVRYFIPRLGPDLMRLCAGGPGLSGIEALDQWNELLLNQTGGEYDIVTWDPRGVGALTVYVFVTPPAAKRTDTFLCCCV